MGEQAADALADAVFCSIVCLEAYAARPQVLAVTAALG
jgi:hypothetical protein